MNDVNTLIDVGRDLSIIEMILGTPTGVGKKPVSQVIITHSHYDHTGLLPEIREVFKPSVCAFSSSLSDVDRVLKDGDTVFAGDRMFEVLHTPGHSSDSICLYCSEEGVLFCGDTSVVINTPGGTYDTNFIKSIERLCRRDIRAIYFGHGAPMLEGCNAALRRTLKNIRQSMQINPGNYPYKKPDDHQIAVTNE